MTIRSDPEGSEILALDALLPDLSNRRVLEVGCGDGRLTRLYSHRAGSVVAIDPDAAKIAAFRDHRPPGRVEARAVGFLDEALDLPDHAFDVIIFSWSL